MTDAPERIWAQDARPDECDFIGGGWWDDVQGNRVYPHTVEYVRADIADTSEVERLRSVLKRIAEAKEGCSGQTLNEYRFQEWARKALNET